MTQTINFSRNFSYIPDNCAVEIGDNLFVAKISSFGQNNLYQGDALLVPISYKLFLLSSLDDVTEVTVSKSIDGYLYSNAFYTCEEYEELRNQKLLEYGFEEEDSIGNMVFSTVTGEKLYHSFIDEVNTRTSERKVVRHISLTLLATVKDIPTSKHVTCLLNSGNPVNVEGNVHCYCFNIKDVVEDAFTDALAKAKESYTFEYSHNATIEFRKINGSYIFGNVKNIDNQFYGTYQQVEDKVKEVYDTYYDKFILLLLGTMTKLSSVNIKEVMSEVNNTLAYLSQVECKTVKASKSLRDAENKLLQLNKKLESILR